MADLWQTPKLHRDEEHERRATWLELFYDLVFVIAIFQLSHVLSKNFSFDSVLSFVLLFIPIWWIWTGSTTYNNRFETDDFSHRVFTFLKIAALVGLSLTIPDGLSAASTWFVLLYVFARTILVVMWLRAGYHNKIVRPVTTRYGVGYSIGSLIWLSSLFLEPPTRFWLWGLGLIVELITPLFTLKHQAKLPKLSPAHLPERYGLFVIIALGEVIISVTLSMAEAPINGSTLLIACLGLLLTFLLWWLYFDNIANHQYEQGPGRTLLWAYLHLPLVMGITAIGAGIQLIDEHTRGSGALLAISGAITLLFMAFIEFTLKQSHGQQCDTKRGRSLRFASVLALTVLAVLHLPPVTLLLLANAIVFSQVVETALHMRRMH